MSPTERVREMEKMVNRSHVLVVPLPGAGHINPMLQFSRRLVSKGLKVTFIITKFISKSRQLGSSIGSIQLDNHQMAMMMDLIKLVAGNPIFQAYMMLVQKPYQNSSGDTKPLQALSML